MLQCMTEPEDVYEYLPSAEVKIVYIKRLLKWLQSFDKTAQIEPLLAVSPLHAWSLMQSLALISLFFTLLSECLLDAGCGDATSICDRPSGALTTGIAEVAVAPWSAFFRDGL